MIVLADTGVLLRLMATADPWYSDANRAVSVISGRGDDIVFSPQNLIEFWGACTRPITARNGLGLSLSETDRRAARIESLFTLVEDLPAIFPIWRQLVVKYGVRGKQVHDTKLTALMLAHGFDTILTFNGSDFTRYPMLNVIDPRTV